MPTAKGHPVGATTGPGRRPPRLIRLLRRAAARRRVAAGHMFRGVCCGVGAGAVSLIVLWVQEGL